MNNAEKIQAVLNTLELIEVKATYDNMNRILGIHKMLMNVRDDLDRPVKAAEAEEVKEENV